MKKYKKIYIEITNHCNLACSFCMKSRRPKAFMPLSDFMEILQRIGGYTDFLSLHVLGEPLLHPDLALFLDLCRSQGLRVNLTTNGTLLSQNQAMLLSKMALRQINISLHSLAQSGKEAALEGYLDEILEFAREARACTPLLVNFRLWNMKTADAAAGQGNALIRRRLASFFSPPAGIPAELTPGQGITLAPGIFLSQDRQFTWPHPPGPDQGSHGFCFGMRDHIAILVDGTVVPCCLDGEADIPLGNIHQAPLTEILAGPRASVLRQGLARQQLHEPLCRRCTYRLRFAAVKSAHTP